MPDPDPNDPKRPRPPDASDDGETPPARIDGDRVIPELTREDFETLPIQRLAQRVGLEPPTGDSAQEEREWREQAWQNHVQDLGNRDEWGTAAQATKPAKGEDPNL